MLTITNSEIFNSQTFSENTMDEKMEACRDQLNKLQNEILNLKMTIQQLFLISQVILANIREKDKKK